MPFFVNFRPMKKRIIQIGVVGVDSGQLMICDPVYIETEYMHRERNGADHAHQIYKDIEDGSMWQYTYDGGSPTVPNVTAFPGKYSDVIDKYGEAPNDLIKEKRWLPTDIDPQPHIPNGEFSYQGICKITGDDKDMGGQLNYTLGHPGAAVAFRSGFGDGVYPVWAEIADFGEWGERIVKVWVDMKPSDADIEEMDFLAGLN